MQYAVGLEQAIGLRQIHNTITQRLYNVPLVRSATY